MKRHDLLVLIVLVGLGFAFSAPFVWGPYAFFPFHSHAQSPWAAEAPDFAADQPVNPNVGDKHSIIHPDLVYTIDQYRQGRAPLWNPNNFAGLPHHAVPLATAAYPLTGIATFFTPITALAVLTAIHLVLGALFAYMYLRGRDLRAGPALLGALCWILGGWMTVHLHHLYFVYTIVWLPLALFAIDRILAARSRWALMVLAVAVGMMLLAGFPQTAVINAYFLAVYAFIGLLDVGRRDGAETAIRRGRFIFSFAALGVLLASIQLLPTIEYLDEAGHQDRNLASLSADALRPATLLHLVVPDLFGHPVDGPAPRESLFTLWLLADGNPAAHLPNNYSERTFHVGVLALLLALAAPLLRRDRATMTLWAGAIVSVVMAMDTPLLDLVHRLPGMDFGSPMRFTQIAGFALPCLFAIGLDAALRRRESLRSGPSRAGLVAIFALPVCLLLVVGISWAAPDSARDAFVEILSELGADRTLGTENWTMERQREGATAPFST